VSKIGPVKKGALHKQVGKPRGKKFTAAELAALKKKADKTKNAKLKKRVVFAQNARKWKKG
jgi:hypothetical protein